MKSHKSGNARFYAVMKKTSGRCYYCGLKKWPSRKPGPRVEITIDHLVSAARGGTDEIDNLVPACRPCNSAKCAGTVADLRHSTAQRILKMPNFSRAQIAWMRRAGADLSAYDNFKFWFETGQERAHYQTETTGLAGMNNGL